MSTPFDLIRAIVYTSIAMLAFVAILTAATFSNADISRRAFCLLSCAAR